MSRTVFIGKRDRNNINTGGGTAPTEADQLSSSTAKLSWGVEVVADGGNNGTVYVGVRSDLSAAADGKGGYPLGAGEKLYLPVDSESEVYIVGSGANQDYGFISY